MKVGVLSGGGDPLGINAVIKAVVRNGISGMTMKFLAFRLEIYGIASVFFG